MYASHHPCWDAKNRYSLPDQMDMSFEEIASLFTNIKQAKSFKEEVEANGLTLENIKSFSEMKGNYPGMDPNDYPAEYKAALIKNINKIKTTLGGN